MGCPVKTLITGRECLRLPDPEVSPNLDLRPLK